MFPEDFTANAITQTQRRGITCHFCFVGRGTERIWQGRRSFRICTTCLRFWFRGWKRSEVEAWRKRQRVGAAKARKGKRGRKQS